MTDATHNTLREQANDPKMTPAERERLILSNIDSLQAFPNQRIWEVIFSLIQKQRVTESLELICHPSNKLMVQARINGLINQYGRHLTETTDVQAMRAAIHDNIINNRNITHFTEKVLTVCLTQGWLEDALAYTDLAVSSTNVKKNPFLLDYYTHIQELLRMTIAEVPIGEINSCLRRTLQTLIEGDKEAEFVKAANLLTAMHYAKNPQEVHEIKVLILQLVELYETFKETPKLTIATSFDVPQGEVLLHHDTDFAERMKAAIRTADVKQVTLVFCSGAYLEYFKVFWAHNKSFLGQVVVVSLDDDAKRWFEGGNLDVIHVNESIYNGASDFGFYLWRKRFEAVNAIIECGVNVCLCGIDSLFYKGAITHFESLPYDIIAGEGPGLPFSAVKSHAALNCDLLFFRASDNVLSLMKEVLDYCGIYLQDQSSLNIIAARNGKPKDGTEHEGVHYVFYTTKHNVTLACATQNFMVRQRVKYDLLKDTGSLWVFQPSDKNEILLMAEQGETNR